MCSSPLMVLDVFFPGYIRLFSFLTAVFNCTAKTLMMAIKKNVADGSTIFRDCWKEYKTNEMRDAGYKHFTVNHMHNFVEPNIGSPT